MPAMSHWSLDLARKTYSIPHWADGYFDVDGQGRVVFVEGLAVEGIVPFLKTDTEASVEYKRRRLGIEAP